MTKHLAQMTGKERETCIGMWVNTPEGYGLLLDHLSMNGYYEPVVLIPSRFAVVDGLWDWDKLELLPHLPRAWEPDGTPPIGVVTAAKARRLPSIVRGETYPYEWAIYEGAVPLERFITKDEALDYFAKLVGEKAGDQ